jgi:hypothetical protein
MMTDARREKVESILPRYYAGETLAELCKTVGWSEKYLQKTISQHHKLYGSQSRKQSNISAIETDIEIISELVQSIGLTKTAIKYGIDKATIRHELQKRGLWSSPAKTTLPISRIDELSRTTIEDVVLITRNNRPLFYVLPLHSTLKHRKTA